MFRAVVLSVVLSLGALASPPNHSSAAVGFKRPLQSGSGGGEVRQEADADAAQRHYQAGLAALEKNDLAAAEEEMQAAARLAPKDAMIFYKLAVIQSKRDEWQPALKNIDAARKLGLPKKLEDEALQLAADVIVKQLQANTAKNNKKSAWFDQMEWLQGKYIYTKLLNHDSDCVKDYHWIDNILELEPEYDKSEFSGTLRLREGHRVSETGATGCADAAAASGAPAESKGESAAAGSKAETKAAPNKESNGESNRELNKDSYREAVLRVVVKRDDGINDGKIRIFATLESCKGNACGTLERETTVYIVEKGEGGSAVISISALSDGDKDGRIEEQFRKQRENRF